MLNKRIIYILLISIYLGVFTFASLQYTGSWILYLIFTIASTICLYTGLKYPVGYGQLFLTIFTWLGFWLKISTHIITGEDYVEATGNFKFDSASYDELLVIITVALISLTLVWFVSIVIIKKDGIYFKRKDWINYQVVSSKFNKKTLLFFLILIIIINGLNWKYQILSVGLTPKDILPWPSNALISMLLGDGFPFIASVLLFASVLSGKYIKITFVIVLFEAVLTSVTTLSRGAIIWHILPVVFVIYLNYSYFNKFKRLKEIRRYIILGTIAIASTMVLANYVRTVQYADRQSVDAEAFNLNKVITQVNRLIIDRWIGAEGAMVAQSNDNNGQKLFLDLLTEKNEPGKVLEYQWISNSIYTGVDLEIFQTGTIPGAVGFLFFSGSLLIVALGMAILGFLMIGFERIIYKITRNVFLVAHLGIWLANAIAQFGLSPRQIIQTLVINFIFIILMYYYQKILIKKVVSKIE